MRRINDEPFDVASLPGSKAVTIKFIIPHSRMGSVYVVLIQLTLTPKARNFPLCDLQGQSS